MLARCHPLCQFVSTASCVGQNRRGCICENDRKCTRDDVALDIRFASNSQPEIGNVTFRDGHCQDRVRIDWLFCSPGVFLLLLSRCRSGLGLTEIGELLANLSVFLLELRAILFAQISLLSIFLQLLKAALEFRDPGRISAIRCVNFGINWFGLNSLGGRRCIQPCQQTWLIVFFVTTLSILLSAERLRAREDPGHRVIVGLRDRVELVIMTARTTQRQTHHRPTDRIHLVVNAVELKLLAVPFVQIHRTQREQAGGDEILLVVFRIF